MESHDCANMKTHGAAESIGIMGVAAGVAILLGFGAEIVHSAIPTIKLPGAYPYETPVQVPAPPPVLDSSPLPSPAPFPYPGSSTPPSNTRERDSRTAKTAHPLTAKAVREAAFKYNGVANFWGFLAVLPADVSVFDPQLGKSRTLVKGGRVMHNNATWLRKHKQSTAHGESGS